MNVISAFAVATLLGSSFAIAQAASPPGAAGTQTAPPPSSSYSQPGAASRHEGESESTARSTKRSMYMKCAKEARTKHVKRADRKQFMKDCESGKSAS